MKAKSMKSLHKWLAISITYLMIISIFSGIFAVIVPKTDLLEYEFIEPESELIMEMPGISESGDNYIVELMHPEDPAMRSSWYLNM
ncbi:MAG: hypothetical protein KAJ51_00780, partial [Thermoplasmata archaeon]|nr:hypothetical protein [Thermoplasmata archaeon]